MHDLSDVTRLPDDFDGRVRLFPLPGLVLFPHAMQPLHIFEPRYCELLLETLRGDGLIAMATLTEGASGANPPIDPLVCIGKVISHAEVENDRHNILLVGTQRARLRREIDAGRTFRIGEVEVLHDIYPPGGNESRQILKQELLAAFGDIVPASASVRKNLHELMAGQMGLGPITDIIAYTLPFDIREKLQLLGKPDVDDRARALVQMLRSGQIDLHSVTMEEQSLESDPSRPDGDDDDDDPRFPPPFSLN